MPNTPQSVARMELIFNFFQNTHAEYNKNTVTKCQQARNVPITVKERSLAKKGNRVSYVPTRACTTAVTKAKIDPILPSIICSFTQILRP